MNKNYKKNLYYTNEDIKKAVKLADDFYNKKYRPQLLRSGNKKLGSNVAIFDLPSIVTCKYKCKERTDQESRNRLKGNSSQRSRVGNLADCKCDGREYHRNDYKL